MAVYPTKGRGKVAQQVDRIVKKVLIRAGSNVVMHSSRLEAVLLDLKSRGLTCSKQIECYSKVGIFSGAELILVPEIQRNKGSLFFQASLVDVKAGKTLRRTRRGPMQESDLHNTIRAATHTLITGKSPVGRIRVRVDVKDAEILIDDRFIASSPMSRPLGNVPEGNHKIVIRAEGYQPAEVPVEVTWNKTSTIVAKLVPKNAPEPEQPANTTHAPQPVHTDDTIDLHSIGFNAMTGGAIATVVSFVSIGTGLTLLYAVNPQLSDESQWETRKYVNWTYLFSFWGGVIAAPVAAIVGSAGGILWAATPEE